MNQTIHTRATDGTDFYQQIATFAYGSFVLHGYGAVIVTEAEFRVHGDGRTYVHPVLAGGRSSR